MARYIEEELVAKSFQIWFPSKLSAPLVQCSIRYSVQSLNLTMGHEMVVFNNWLRGSEKIFTNARWPAPGGR